MYSYSPVILHQFTSYYFPLSNEAIAKLWNDAATFPKSNFPFLLEPPSAFPCIFDSTSASSWNDPQQSTSAISTRVFLKAFFKNWLLQQSWVIIKSNKKNPSASESQFCTHWCMSWTLCLEYPHWRHSAVLFAHTELSTCVSACKVMALNLTRS